MLSPMDAGDLDVAHEEGARRGGLPTTSWEEPLMATPSPRDDGPTATTIPPLSMWPRAPDTHTLHVPRPGPVAPRLNRRERRWRAFAR